MSTEGDAAIVSSPVAVVATRGQLPGGVLISNDAIPQIGNYKSRHLTPDTVAVEGSLYHESLSLG